MHAENTELKMFESFFNTDQECKLQGINYNTGLSGLYNTGLQGLYKTRDWKIWVQRNDRYNLYSL